MLSKANFTQQLTDAYGHLYDMLYLRTHPLVDILVPDPILSRKEKAWKMHHILLDIIDELKPGSQAPVFSRQWRRHRLMVLRYVKALEPQTVADQLTISRRHYYREHTIIMRAVADILWDRYVEVPATSQQFTSPVVEVQNSDNNLELLRLEAARMAQTGRYARIDNVVEGALSLLEEILFKHELTVDLSLPASLPSVAIDQQLLRQLLLGTLGYLIEGANQAIIQLAAHIEEAVVHLSVRIEPPAALPASETEVQEKLATFEEIATLSDAHVEPIYAEQTIIGFVVQLPVARRTVLVVDDNEDVLELFQRYLSSHHYHVVTTPLAREARELAQKLQPDAITLDLMIPDQDGWEVMQILLNQPDTQHIPIIVCSVLKQKDLALSLGATAFLEKPVTEQALLSVLKALEQG